LSLINKSIAALFFCLLCASLLCGCGTPGIPLPPSLELPKPVSDLRATRKGNKVYLTWTIPSQTTDRQTIRHFGITRICRSGTASLAPDASGQDACRNEVGTVPPAKTPSTKTPSVAASGKANSSPLAKPIESYTDEVPSSGTDISGEFTYAIEVMNDRGRSAGLSNQVRASAAPTRPPPANFAAEVRAEGIAVSWSPIPQPGIVSGLNYLYRIYRREENGKDTVAGELAVNSASDARFVDHNFAWEKRYSYHATIVTLIDRTPGPEAEVEGDDTPQVSVVTRDIFPPAVPSGLQAAFTSEDKHPFIDLIWNPDTESDLAGYNVFRHEDGGQPAKINSDLVKLPAFRDLAISAGKKYYYSVSAVDIRGNESERSEEANEIVP
jgi:hypothetical protein